MHPADINLLPADINIPPADINILPADIILLPADIILLPADVILLPADVILLPRDWTEFCVNSKNALRSVLKNCTLIKVRITVRSTFIAIATFLAMTEEQRDVAIF